MPLSGKSCLSAQSTILIDRKKREDSNRFIRRGRFCPARFSFQYFCRKDLILFRPSAISITILRGEESKRDEDFSRLTAAKFGMDFVSRKLDVREFAKENDLFC